MGIDNLFIFLFFFFNFFADKTDRRGQLAQLFLRPS